MILSRIIKDSFKASFPKLWVKYVAYREGYVEPELDFLNQIVPKNLISLDIGANIGLYTLALCKLAPVVHAFEPAAEMAAVLRKIVPDNVRVHELALSDKSGVSTLSTPTADGHHTYGLSSLQPREGEAFLRATVQTARLDDLGISGIGFIKIDVEGHELSVIDGAKNTIAKERPILLIECEERYNPGGVSALTKFFSAAGYAGRFFYLGHMRDLSEFDIEKHQGEMALKSGQYAYNFFFFPNRPLI